MAEESANRLLDLVRQSGLVTEDRLQGLLDTLAGTSEGVPDDAKKLADKLIAAGLLTSWQADKLLAGKHKGFRLGKYKLLAQIGKGGMSQVYLAEHVMMRRRVAIKVLPRNRVKDKSYLERFQLEARAVARLDDPNIVRAYDIDNEGSIHYIVMEYVEGKDLHQIVAEYGPLDYDTAADYIAQTANGLQHAHEMGLVHRDIKPANCLVDGNQTIKLLDLGLARVINDEDMSLTLANEENVLGTADYLAPEQALNSHKADARADIYSLGCTLYYLLCGRPPFPEGSISERLLKHQIEEPESILKFRVDAPLSLVDICRRMMAKRPEERYQTAGEVAQVMTDWLAARGRNLRGGHIGGHVAAAGSSGSGILGRYTAPSGTLPGSGPFNPLTPRPPSSKAPLSLRDTTKLFGPDTDPDEDIGLAPLEDDAPAKSVVRPPAGSSGVLSEDIAKAEGAKPLPAAGPPSSKSSKSAARKRSLFEEEAVTTTPDPSNLMKAARSQPVQTLQYDPLHPPGYKNPYNRTPWGLWIGVGLAVIALVVLAALLLF